MSRFLNKKYWSLKEYTPGEQPKDTKYVKLNTNESPFAPPKKAKQFAKDIAYVFGTNIIDARKIKEKFASCHKRFTNLNDTYELKNDMNEIVKLSQLEVTEVVMSRMIEILEYVKKQIKLLTKKDIQYIVLTGGLTEIKSFKNLVYEILGKDVIIYLIDEIGIRDNKYTTALGMIKYFVDKMTIRGKDYSMISLEDEELLLTPDDKKRKEKAVVTKIFKGFIRNKEEK